MVTVKNPAQYRFVKFIKSNTKNKKYDAILWNRKTDRFKRIPFGDKRYQQYKDSTGLNLYSKLDHLDLKRRRNFRKRHEKNAKKIFSSAFFSYHYLW